MVVEQKPFNQKFHLEVEWQNNDIKMEKKEKLKKLRRYFFKKILYLIVFNKVSIKNLFIFNKSCSINFFCINNFFFLHNGSSFRKLYVSSILINLKFNFFVFTKKPFKYLLKKKKR